MARNAQVERTIPNCESQSSKNPSYESSSRTKRDMKTWRRLHISLCSTWAFVQVASRHLIQARRPWLPEQHLESRSQWSETASEVDLTRPHAWAQFKLPLPFRHSPTRMLPRRTRTVAAARPRPWLQATNLEVPVIWEQILPVRHAIDQAPWALRLGGWSGCSSLRSARPRSKGCWATRALSKVCSVWPYGRPCEDCDQASIHDPRLPLSSPVTPEPGEPSADYATRMKALEQIHAAEVPGVASGRGTGFTLAKHSFRKYSQRESQRLRAAVQVDVERELLWTCLVPSRELGE